MTARRKVVGLSDVVALGDRRASLEALRNHLARELENAPAGVAIGPIAKELRTTIAELDALPGVREGSKSDELASRRASRVAAARSAKTAGQ